MEVMVSSAVFESSGRVRFACARASSTPAKAVSMVTSPFDTPRYESSVARICAAHHPRRAKVVLRSNSVRPRPAWRVGRWISTLERRASSRVNTEASWSAMTRNAARSASSALFA